MRGFSTERSESKQPEAHEDSDIIESERQEVHLPEQTTCPQAQASSVLFNFQPPQQSYHHHHQPQQNFGGALQGNNFGNRHILVITPRNESEMYGIVDHLKTNEAVIVNFEGIPSAETQRRVDFLSGVASGIGGTMRPLDTFKYIITPSGIGIR